MLVTRGNNFADEYAIHLRGKIVVRCGPQAAFDLIGERRAFVYVKQIE